jgi:cytochrome b involved in lipid metabolism
MKITIATILPLFFLITHVYAIPYARRDEAREHEHGHKHRCHKKVTSTTSSLPTVTPITPDPTPNPPPTPDPTPNPPPPPSGISLSTVSQHNSLSDCWVVFQSNVYDMTTWVNLHPGGSGVYTNLCGTNNFESAFANKHGSSKNSLFISSTTLKGAFAG